MKRKGIIREFATSYVSQVNVISFIYSDKTIQKMKIVSLFCSIILVAVSCNKLEKKHIAISSEYQNIKVNLENDSIIKFSDIIKSSFFLKLETKNDALIGNIDKLVFDSGKIFIADKDIAEAIFIYSDSGKFLKKIDGKGQAPGEFLEIRDFTLDTVNKYLYVLDLQGRKVNVYNYEGEFLRSNPMPFLFSAFAYINSNIFAMSTATAYNKQNPKINNHYLVTAELSGKIVSAEFPFNNKERDFTYFNAAPLRTFGSKVLFYPRYSNTIYEVGNNSTKLLYSLDFNGKGIPSEERETLNDVNFLKLQDSYSYFSGDYADLDRFAYFIVNTPKGNRKLFFSKKSKKTLITSRYLISDPMHNFITTPIATKGGDTLVTFAKSMEVLNLKALAVGKDTVVANRLANNLSLNSNPILFFYNLKEF
ncbi:hypothetical protein Pedsa_0287 [Pseudopedobacter saltans DSM 12145]|uniref:6-bladed beta-propeller n=1 Tax=Pseudopedobacter saltans (strain ATCC 51119 / DSM 12145 / JCM 21818 / CCUG 39354 / LMG 10337 / NBRC 100064 / NCIMB 13643) TaxID=762903 RepID=F0S4B5_PSESL|nr:6-bladed beta-propeller [Pseudopedobacter saltans]ADY50872.1 hypothetical protein Pedsa_0287 [Pseudopedobacter saltans DSM 12145]